MKRGFTIHHNGPPARCVGKPHARCLAFWEAVRRFHVEDKGWSGIAYSFGVCPHGVRLSGQGWDRRQFANGVDLVGANNGTDGDWYTVLVFVGGDVSTGDEEAPTAQMIQATADLIAEGRRTGRCGTQVLPHKDFKQKPCPGSAFTALCREWHNQPLPTTQLQEDDMPLDANDLSKITSIVRDEQRRGLAFLMAGAGNAVTDGQTWVPNAVTLPKLLAAAALPADVDEAAIAAALAPVLSAALVEALPDEVTDALDADEFEALVVSALGSVKLTPDPD